MLLAGRDVEFDDAVILVLGRLGRCVAFSLLRAHVHEERTVVGVADIFQHRQQLFEIVTVDDADVVEPELLEQSAAGDETTGELFRERGFLLEELRQVIGKLLSEAAQRHVHRARQQPREIVRHRADGRGDRHLVVVQDDDEAPVHRAGVVHGLVSHAGRHCAVADHADHVMFLAGKVARHRHAQSGGYRGRGMRCAEGVVFALGALRESGQAAAGTQGANAITPAGQNFVRISLVADVPDQLVIGRVKNVVKGHREFDDAEARAEMTAGDGDRVDRFSAQLIGNLLQVPCIDTAQISRTLDGVEDGWMRLIQRVVIGRRHALLTLPRLNGGAEALADPHGIKFCRPIRALPICHEVSSQRQSMTRAKVPNWRYWINDPIDRV